MKVLYIIYQYLIALPIYLVLTLFTALVTIIAMPWRNAAWVHAVQQFWARSFCWLLLLPVEVEGLENITPGQSYVFVSNHQGTPDVFVIYGWLPVIFKWIMKQELRKVPFIGAACAAAGHIYLDRRSRAAAKHSIEQAEHILKDGICVVIFPEGTRSLTGEVGRFKRGAFSIASDLKLPVIPISLSGCYEVMPKKRFYAKWHPIKMRIGKPMDVSIYAPEERDEAIRVVREAVIAGMTAH
ncbi:MAG: 1-acyl-sn-glycerol-3-phosphate acyltransferase [Paludibacter sp.]|nr:1-acyl-sn-glycerol-3-phosphate acyltransferase [Bacteroidales bacterium]MCM1068547.1 1-acyl-sn-glycerol-3-phosphate acyltransferase [Prevotella sp.]MCM1353211.1 1-acyl-sn-glycerol-3-phosphate acyltransferase [Bacteroides sp.]MCM1442381.1 1-acyl-sn-glycerol-3-phosphate acyltransferase [Muribaculum sp.]MCM1481200.1 1-acyl-sn-glycerol-3-phosphate acyltransferase [Paludibacter sp.]